MEPASLAADTGYGCEHDHLVQFYDTESFLVETVCSVLTPALGAGDAAIVVATDTHRKLFEAAFRRAGIDVDAAIDDGRYLPFDAEAVLRCFMIDGRPDAATFQRTIGAVFDVASEGERRIRVYGEMVALLWDDGDVASALALEDLWNDLAAIHAFDLLCAYPMRAFEDEASTVAFKRICKQHTTVIPGEGYSLLATPADRSREVAQLQQQAAALTRELLRLRAPARDRVSS
jgi:hypothetical protein